MAFAYNSFRSMNPKAAKLVAKIRQRSYDVFLRTSFAESLDQLIIPLNQPPLEDTCWVWLVNYGEQGGQAEQKRGLLKESLGDQPVWVPLIGLVCCSASVYSPAGWTLANDDSADVLPLAFPDPCSSLRVRP